MSTKPNDMSVVIEQARNEDKQRLRLIKIKCKQCDLFSWVDPNVVHAEEGTPFVWHCTYCTHEIQKEKMK